MEKIAEGFKGERAIVTPYNIRDLQSKNEITQQLYVTHIGYYPHAKNHYRARPDGAPENILIYCDSGKGWVEHNDERHYLKRNMVYIIPAAEAHEYAADKQDPWSILWMHFKGERLFMFKEVLGKIILINDSDNSRYKDRLLLFEEIFQNLEMGYSPENMEYTSFCLMHYLASLKYISQFRIINNVNIDDVVQKCILLMKENLETPISLNELAESVGYSSSHLNKLFSQKTSYSLMEYYNQLRIQRACTYLQFTDIKIKEIAYNLGYYDPYHFSKAFQREMEISPKEYRKRYNESAAHNI